MCQYSHTSVVIPVSFCVLQNIFLLLSNVKTDNEVEQSPENDTPEGYYAFIQSPSSFPPTVRPPPYQPINRDCADYKNTKPLVSPNNLCGDLNKGMIPRNPMSKLNSLLIHWLVTQMIFEATVACILKH